MNAWIITWNYLHEPDYKRKVNLIAAILPSRTSRKDVVKIVALLYANYIAASSLPKRRYVSPQVDFAAKKQRFKPTCDGFGFIACYYNPFPILYARVAYKLKKQEEKGHEILTWEEECPPTLDRTRDVASQLGEITPLRRKRMKYYARTNTFSQEEYQSESN